jgi:metal-sulfur cluster biosynthetic enzyme
MEINKKKVLSKLSEVLDPELNISIVDLGLVYKVTIVKAAVKILMTLTTIGCPLISLIETEIKNKLSELGILEKNIIIELTFDPPWSMEKMSEKAKALLGIS